MYKARQLALAALCSLATGMSDAGSLNYCQGQAELSAALQDRLIQVAAVVKDILEQSGQSVALMARSGLALQRLDQRYSHAGVSLKNSPNAPWSVRQLYYACDEQRPRIFDQGVSGFVLGAHDPTEGYLSIVLLPPVAADPLEHTAMDDRTSLQLLGSSYSANAHAFSERYQNCNQWLVELLAAAWGNIALNQDARKQAQDWLIAEGYVPTVLHLGWQPLMWLARLLPWLHSDDHPTVDLDAAQFRVSLPRSIEGFVQGRLPQARRVEICYTAKHIVIHLGWDPIAEGCEPATGDTVMALSQATTAR